MIIKKMNLTIKMKIKSKQNYLKKKFKIYNNIYIFRLINR